MVNQGPEYGQWGPLTNTANGLCSGQVPFCGTTNTDNTHQGSLLHLQRPDLLGLFLMPTS